MDKPDARHLPIETQNYLRRQAIRLRIRGKRICDISEYLGVHANTVSEWWSKYIDVGETALDQQKRGRELGEGRTLSPLRKLRLRPPSGDISLKTMELRVLCGPEKRFAP